MKNECLIEGFTAEDVCRVLNRAGEAAVSVDDVHNWFDKEEADPGYQIQSESKIVEEMCPAEGSDEEEEKDEVEAVEKINARF